MFPGRAVGSSRGCSPDFTCSHPFSFHPSVSIPSGFSPDLHPSVLLIPSTAASSLFPSSWLSVHPYLYFSTLLCLPKSSCPTSAGSEPQGPAGLPSSCPDSRHIPSTFPSLPAALSPAQRVRSTRNKQGFSCLPTAVSCFRGQNGLRHDSCLCRLRCGLWEGAGRSPRLPRQLGEVCWKRVLTGASWRKAPRSFPNMGSRNHLQTLA